MDVSQEKKSKFFKNEKDKLSNVAGDNYDDSGFYAGFCKRI